MAIQFEYVPPDPNGIPSIYANNVTIGTSAFDVRILFGELIAVTENKVVVEQKIKVTMGWLEAKLLAEFLAAQISAFESANGTLKFPEVPVMQPASPIG